MIPAFTKLVRSLILHKLSCQGKRKSNSGTFCLKSGRVKFQAQSVLDMSKSISFQLTYVTLLGLALIVSLAFAQEQEVITKDKLGLTIPNPFGDKPIFETNDQNGRLVSLHIP